MRGKIRLDGRKNSLTEKGFPIIIYLTDKYSKQKEKIIQTGYHSFKEHWDKANALPTREHPERTSLLNYLEAIKIRLNTLLDRSKMEIISFGYAEQYLTKNDVGVFYNDAMALVKKLDLRRVYVVALNSFNSHFPEYSYTQIDRAVVESYIRKLQNTPVNGKKRSPNGIISYLNTLTAAWNKLDRPNNPFAGIRPTAKRTQSKSFTPSDIEKLKNHNFKPHPNTKAGGVANYCNYLLLCFYLGGIDLVDLKELRYDKHVIDGRIEFNRHKGGTNAFVSNKIFPEAKELLKLYNCRPYFIPLKMYQSYEAFLPNISRRFSDIKDKLGLSKLPYSKSPRYTFINFAKELLIDERIAKQLVGHTEHHTHSLYKDAFPNSVIDQAHRQIIDFNKK